MRIAASRLRFLAPIAFGGLLLVLWQLASSLGLVSRQLLPAPAELAARFAAEIGRGRLAAFAAVTMQEALLGSLFAVCVAVPLGYAIARVRWVGLAVSPYVAASQAIPAIAIAPLLVVWIGYGLTPIAVLCAITAFFPMLVTTVLGIRQLPQDVLEAARLDGANAWQSLVHIEVPLALPSVLAGVRAGATLSITGAVVGEFTMGGRGLGMLLTLYRDANDTEGLFTTLLVLVLMAVLLFTILQVLERWFLARAPRALPGTEPGAAGMTADDTMGDTP